MRKLCPRERACQRDRRKEAVGGGRRQQQSARSGRRRGPGLGLGVSLAVHPLWPKPPQGPQRKSRCEMEVLTGPARGGQGPWGPRAAAWPCLCLSAGHPRAKRDLSPKTAGFHENPCLLGLRKYSFLRNLKAAQDLRGWQRYSSKTSFWPPRSGERIAAMPLTDAHSQVWRKGAPGAGSGERIAAMPLTDAHSQLWSNSEKSFCSDDSLKFPSFELARP
jgi:hypothetical protein